MLSEAKSLSFAHLSRAFLIDYSDFIELLLYGHAIVQKTYL